MPSIPNQAGPVHPALSRDKNLTKLISKPSVGEYLRELMTKQNVPLGALVEPLHLKAEEAVEMILNDKAKLPIKYVPVLASLFQIDGVELMAVVLANQAPETLLALDKVTEGLFLSGTRLVIVDLL